MGNNTKIFHRLFGLESFVESSLFHSNANNAIDLSNFSITDEHLKSIALIIIKTKHAFSLNLQQCGGITSDGFSSFAESITNVSRLLISLNLSDCPKIDDYSCKSIGRFFKRLNSINLNCCRVSGVGVEYILKGCKYINELRIRNVKLGDRGMEELRMYAVMTKKLKVLGR